eukprot:TRINITY_DN8534_c0_g1_i1.p1 TRINITY_DN8534_c0_g1~~TRINITY_DN8534_c0_g1_i1.p1  ORF type:complete len:885 (-),score=209.47 TRINITY_DN8534_c0_g1_i1:81-2735(-)
MPSIKAGRLAVAALLLGLLRGSGLEQVQQLRHDGVASSSAGAVGKTSEELLQQRIIVALEGEVRALKRVAELEEEVKHLKGKLVECDGKLHRCEAAGTVVLDRRLPPAATNLASVANLTAASVAATATASEDVDFDVLSSLPKPNNTKHHGPNSSTVDSFVNDFASALIPLVLAVLAYGVLTARSAHGEHRKKVLGSSAEGALSVSRGARSIVPPPQASGGRPDDSVKLSKDHQDDDRAPTERKLYEPKWNQSMQKKDEQSLDSSPGIASTMASLSPIMLDPGQSDAWTPATKSSSLEPHLLVQMEEAPGLPMPTSFLQGSPPGLLPPPPGLPPPGPPPGLTGLAPASVEFLSEGGPSQARPSALPPACPQGGSEDSEYEPEVKRKCVTHKEWKPAVDEEKAAVAPREQLEEAEQEDCQVRDGEEEEDEAPEEDQAEQEDEAGEEEEEEVEEEGKDYEEEGQETSEKDTWQKARRKETRHNGKMTSQELADTSGGAQALKKPPAVSKLLRFFCSSTSASTVSSGSLDTGEDQDWLPDEKVSNKGKDRKKQPKEPKEPKLMKKKAQAAQAPENEAAGWLRAARSLVTTPFGLMLTGMLCVTLLGRVASPGCGQMLPFNKKSEHVTERSRSGSERCASKVPDHVIVLEAGSDLPEPKDVKPAIALHAKCFLNIFQGVAKKYRPTGTWYWVKDVKRPRVEIRHAHEEPKKLSNPRDNTTIVNFLTDNIFPMFGQLNQITYEWYSMQHDAGLVMLLSDPAQHSSLEEAQAHWRPTFQALHETFLLKYFMTFAPTFDQQDRDWLRQEFGVRSFPALVVQASLQQFIQDVDEGCLGWKPPRLTFAGLRPISEREAPRCMWPEEDDENHGHPRAALEPAEDDDATDEVAFG